MIWVVLVGYVLFALAITVLTGRLFKLEREMAELRSEVKLLRAAGVKA